MSLLHVVQPLLHTYGYPLIFVLLTVECAGLIAPGETVLLAAALFAAHGKMNIFAVVACAMAGGIAGNLIGYGIGRRFGRTLLVRHGHRIGLNARRQALGRYLFAHHGGKVVFFSRFTALLRSFAGVMAGTNAMPFRAFLLWTVLGGIVWPSVHGFGAYALGNAAKKLSTPVSFTLGTTAVVALLLAIRLAKRNEHRMTEAALRWERGHASAGG